MSAEHDNEDLKMLGSDFKAAREAKGFSLKDINDKTRISVTILDAIENGNIHLFPPGVYARNFIRTYADFLGIDSQPILEHIQKQSEQAAPPVLQRDDSGSSPVADPRRWKVLVLGAVAMILVGVLFWFLISYWNPGRSTSMTAVSQGDVEKTVTPQALPADAGSARKNNAVLPVSTTPSQVQTDTMPTPSAVAGVSQHASLPDAGSSTRMNVSAVANPADYSSKKEPEETAGPYQLTIEAKDRTWLRIRADNGERSQHMMRPGERMNRRAQERFSLDIGNAAGVSIFFQGRKLENLGKQGQVVHLNLP